MKTAPHTARPNTSRNNTLIEDRAEIRHLIELQPEYFQRDIVAVERPARSRKGIASIIPFPLSSWTLRSV